MRCVNYDLCEREAVCYARSGNVAIVLCARCKQELDRIWKERENGTT